MGEINANLTLNIESKLGTYTLQWFGNCRLESKTGQLNAQNEIFNTNLGSKKCVPYYVLILVPSKNILFRFNHRLIDLM